jgi:site-specific recombinase XerC
MPCEIWQRQQQWARQAHRRIPDPDALLATLPVGSKDTYRVLAALLAKHNERHAVKDKGVSHKTMSLRGDFLFHFFRQLRAKTRFSQLHPRQLRSQHIAAMVDIWVDEGKSTGTIHVYLSYLRVFSMWIGKAGLVHPVPYYFGHNSNHAHRTQGALAEKSWTASGIDVDAKITEASQIDPWVGLQLELMRSFGLRAKEAMFFRPNEAVLERDQARRADAACFPDATHFVRLRQGAKGGRVRDVPVVTDHQRALVDRCKQRVPTGGFVGQQRHSPQQSRARFYYVLSKVGITKASLGVVSHGLRHGYANDLYEQMAGTASPVRGANSKPANDNEARLATARALGHGRTAVTSCYLGSSAAQPKTSPPAPGEATHSM